MQLDELIAKEAMIKKARIKQLRGGQNKINKIDFNVTENKITLGNQELSTWVTFFVVASLASLSFCYIAFGETRVSVCGVDALPIIETLCVGWQLLFMLTFSVVVLPITFLVGMAEFFQSLKQKTKSLKELSEQLQYQKDVKVVSRLLVYSSFVLAVQMLVHFSAFDFLPDVLRLPFIVFETDAMLPIALALLYYAVRKKELFCSVSISLLYVVIFVNIVSVIFSRGLRLVWESNMERFF